MTIQEAVQILKQHGLPISLVETERIIGLYREEEETIDGIMLPNYIDPFSINKLDGEWHVKVTWHVFKIRTKFKTLEQAIQFMTGIYKPAPFFLENEESLQTILEKGKKVGLFLRRKDFPPDAVELEIPYMLIGNTKNTLANNPNGDFLIARRGDYFFVIIFDLIIDQTVNSDVSQSLDELIEKLGKLYSPSSSDND